jgi:hypothetical protein
VRNPFERMRIDVIPGRFDSSILNDVSPPEARVLHQLRVSESDVLRCMYLQCMNTLGKLDRDVAGLIGQLPGVLRSILLWLWL